MKLSSLPCRIARMTHIGDRIREAREARKMSQSDLARALGIRPQAVNNWESGATQPRPQKYPDLCRVLGVTRSYLLGEQNLELTNITPGPDIVKKIPIISWVRAGQWSEAIDMTEPGYAEDWEYTSEKVGPNAFMLRVVGDSMEPMFPAGLLLTIDPGIEARPGDYVVAKVGDHATFKQLTQDAGRLYLTPLNPRYPVIEVDEHTKIVGVVMSATRRFRH